MNEKDLQCRAMQFIPCDLRDEVNLHIENVRSQMLQDGIEACLIGANPNICYLTLRFFRGYVWVPAQGNPVWFTICPEHLQGDMVRVIRKVEQIPALLAELGVAMPERLGVECGELPYSEVMRIKKAFGGIETVDCTLTLRHARMVKTEWEQKQMRVDGALQASVYAKVPDLYREGMTDVELQIAIEGELRKKGCLGYPRVSGRLMQINLGSVISGDNADCPSPYDFSMGGAGVDPTLPVGADGKEILLGTAVMVDMNGAFNAYQSDMTRTWRVGDLPEAAMSAHQCSCDILRELEKCKPGTPIADMYRKAVEMTRERGLEEYFMGHNRRVAFIGHGVGIELNELPVVMERSHDILQEGMTIALEPKFVIPHVGAVGVENTYIATPDGLESITVGSEEIANLI